ncbi:MAG: inositol monophosphatase family protein [Thermodesulfobacteriota bacterium]
MSSFKQIAVKAAKQAGIILKKNLSKKRKIAYKGVVNLVTEMDFLTEEIITSLIKKHFPNHNILAEEKVNWQGDSAYRWIIDPLDGTTNYAHGFPIFCVSIALEKDNEIILGIVYDPMREELFIGEKGKGARLNGQKIHVSSVPKLSQSLLATGFPYDLRESSKNNFDHFRNFALRVHAVRRAGSAALDLCYVAAGRFDGFWEMKLGPWDFAAGSLIVKEAGGKVTDFGGHPLNLNSGHVLASNGKIHQEMLSIIKMGNY